MKQAPTITTQRLVLRPHRREDFPPMATHFATDWARFMGGPIDADEMWRSLASEVVSWDWQGFGSWAVDLADGTFIGQVGITQPPRFPEPELGWCLFPGFEGQGYALEAATAARDWGFEVRGLDTLVSYIDAGNTRSIALAERLGGAIDTNAARPDDPTDVVFRHIPSDCNGSVEAYA